MKTIISNCGKYRYQLWRKIPQPLRWIREVTFVMLNPSIADASIDDPTIRRCMAFAKREGFTDMYAINLFAYRATNPKELAIVADPHGPDNYKFIDEVAILPGTVIVAWGGKSNFGKSRKERILRTGRHLLSRYN